mmetsp:Transcript_34873/g.77519  ORF Transcript_34873/g.77519 Transcript_34873/m.77519 type:complete len:88 (+) Transcript_34873:119-382(+)
MSSKQISVMHVIECYVQVLCVSTAGLEKMSTGHLQGTLQGYYKEQAHQEHRVVFYSTPFTPGSLTTTEPSAVAPPNVPPTRKVGPPP